VTWRTTRIKHTSLVSYGLGQPPPLSESGVPILRATNIARGKFTSDGLIFAAKHDLPLDRAPLLKEGEILVVRSGAYTGDSALVTNAWSGSSPGYDLRVSPVCAHPAYIAYCLLSKAALDQVDLAKARAAQPHLNAEDLGDVVISLPPVDEQRRIADFLDIETDRLERVSELQGRVRSAIQSRNVAQLDSRIETLTNTYGALPFRRTINAIEQGVSPQCDNFAAEPGSWGVLKVSAVKNGSFLEAENKKLPLGIEPDRRYEIKHGDLLITRANTPNLVGAAAVAGSPRSKLMLCDKIFRVRTTPDLLPEFLVLVSLCTRVRSMCTEVSHGTSASMANLKTDEIKRWPIPRAPIADQWDAIAEFSATRDQTAALTDAIDRQLALLAERRQALITAAVTGQIDVTTVRGVDV
jgi:type I restriction enzyme S subunit